MFAGRTIKGFKEFRYFTSLRNGRGYFAGSTFGTIMLPEGLKVVPHSMFENCKGECVIIPATATALDELVFHDSEIKNLVLKGDVLLEADRYWCCLGCHLDNLYVASHLIEEYRQSPNWGKKILFYIKHIRPLSEYQP